LVVGLLGQVQRAVFEFEVLFDNL
jgi:hypothetical protein